MKAFAALALLLAAVLPAPAAVEGATTYHFGVSESRTNVQFESETSLEVIHGITHVIKGSVAFDFEKGEGSGTLTVPVKSLDTGLPARDGHMRSDGWLDEEKFPDIVFKAKALKRLKQDEASKKETWSYEGDLTIHGVTKPLKGEAQVQRVPEELGKKLGPGSWVKVKTAFQVTLKDFDITIPEMTAAKVAPTWDVKVDVFGTTEPPAEKQADKPAEKPAEKKE
jgi:polyisoprenoid-binding protein YceI